MFMELLVGESLKARRTYPDGDVGEHFAIRYPAAKLRFRNGEKAPESKFSTRKETHQRASSGTGFFVSSAGHVVTNAHVVDDCKKLM